MSDSSLLLFLYTETPLHVGSGAGVGAVDLPIIREKLSGLPLVPGSGIKGALREIFPEGENLTEALFGPAPADPKTPDHKPAETWAGAMSLLDARLLLLPVRSIFGGFAWVTSPLACHRLARDIERLSGTLPPWAGLSITPVDQETLPTAWVGTHSVLSARNELLLEDLPYRPVRNRAVDQLAATLKKALPEGPGYNAFRDRMPQHLMIVSDGEFGELTGRHTEIVTRTRIDAKTGTVAKGQLWTEENLPSESLLWGVVAFERSRHPNPSPELPRNAAAMRDRFVQSEAMKGRCRLRLGGNRTVGRGLVGLRAVEGRHLLVEEDGQ